MILTPLLSLDYSSFSLSNVKSTFQKENDSKDEEKLLDEKSDSVKIKSAASGNVATASTKEYIIGCVAAEMPATYSTEALKAQAVCAYTNLVRLKKIPIPRFRAPTYRTTPDVIRAITTPKHKRKNGAINTTNTEPKRRRR